jgi:hypothetical protein
MKASTKGALLSLLIYPGVGQLALGFKISGVLFAVLATAGLLVVLFRITVRVFHALDLILSSLAENTLHWSKLFQIVSRSPYDSWQVEGISLVCMLLCWIAAGLHAYLAGQRIDKIDDFKSDA